MAVSNNEILVQIVTAANMAGIAEAKSALLGFNPATLALAAGLAGVVKVGKDAIDNYEAQTEALNNLTNAIEDRNKVDQQANDPKAIAGVQKAQENLQKAQQALGLEEDKLAGKRKLTKIDLDELRIKNDAVTKAQNDLAAADAKVSQSHQAQRYDSQVLQQQVRDFIVTNKDFIDNQYDAVNGFAAFVREGVPAKDLTTAMTAAMDISAAEHISLAQAVDLVQSAESGRATGLRKLVGIQLENVSATATQAEKEKTAADNLTIVAAAYQGAHNNLTDLQRSQNDLNADWQHFTSDIGPGVETALDGIVKGLDAVTVAADNAQNALQAWGGSSGVNAAVGAFQGGLLDLPGISGLAELQTLKNQAAASANSANFSAAAHQRPINVTINVNAASDPETTARKVAAQFKKMTAF